MRGDNRRLSRQITLNFLFSLQVTSLEREREEILIEKEKTAHLYKTQAAAAKEELELLQAKMAVQRREFDALAAASKKEFDEEIEKLKAHLETVKTGADQVTTELAASQKEVTTLEGDLDKALREKETIKVGEG